MAVPGFDATPFTATGLEHDEYGEPDYTPEMHAAQLDKRGHKFEIAAGALCGLQAPLGCATYGVPEAEAEVGVLAWAPLPALSRRPSRRWRPRAIAWRR